MDLTFRWIFGSKYVYVFMFIIAAAAGSYIPLSSDILIVGSIFHDNSATNVIITILVVGTGSACGAMISFFLAKGLIFSWYKKRPSFEMWKKRIESPWGTNFILFTAITPVPIDIACAAAGAVNYKTSKMIRILLIGRYIRAVYVAFFVLYLKKAWEASLWIRFITVGFGFLIISLYVLWCFWYFKRQSAKYGIEEDTKTNTTN